MEILAYIGTHWVEWLFGLCLALLGWGWKVILSKLKEEQAHNEAVAEGVQALLRESIVGNYNKYHSKNYCPIYAKESVKKVFEAYKALGGNSVAEDLYNKLLDMPTEKEDET